MDLVLVGNPNVGKTTLYNNLTESANHTGNWHGVTMGHAQKIYTHNNKTYNVVDLPGIYSLSPLSFEEKEAIDFFYYNKNYLVLNIVDINTLNKNLYLTLELLSAGLNVLVIANNMGKKSNGKQIKALKEQWNINIIEIDATNKKDILKLKEQINNINLNNFKKNNQIIKLNTKIKGIFDNFKNNIDFSKINTRFDKYFFALKLIEQDEYYIKKANQNIQNLKNTEILEDIIKQKYNAINEVLKNQSTMLNKDVYGKSKLDNFVLNKYLSLPIFLCILFVIFYITFFGVGKSLSNLLSNFFQNNFGSWLVTAIKNITGSATIIDFFETAIVGGLGAVFSFLPQVVILFLCLGVLEDSGYLSRVAFCLDDIFSKVGLSGKSVYTLLMGFGCSTSACLTCRNVEDKNSKIKSAMLAPYMSCSAKLPIYVVIGSAFFGANNVFVIFFMYLLGVLVSLGLSVFYEKTFLKSGRDNFILEFPKYKATSIKRCLFLAKDSAKQFLIRIGSVLITVNIIVWVLSSFSFKFEFIKITGGVSILQRVGEIISPIFAPLGFGTWGASSALVAGLVAKEIIVSSIAMFNGVRAEGDVYYQNISKSLTRQSSAVCLTPASAISFMTFCLLYSPCLATMSVLKQEVGKKWLFVSIVTQISIAYVVSLFLHTSISIILSKGIVLYLAYVAIFALVAFACFRLLFCKKKCTCNGKC